MGQSRTFVERQVESSCLGQTRTIRISLPASYDQAPRKRYPVLYLHDGQNVFSFAGRDCCFGWGSWEVDLIVAGLVAEGKMRDVILVGIDNSRARYMEYRGPAHDSDDTPKAKGKAKATEHDSAFKKYSSFIMHELKPRIDEEYRTWPKASTTGLMGSSLGGICSLAMAWEHPKVFGLSASLSSSLHIEHGHFLHHVLKKYRGRPKAIKIYIDSGTFDSGGDDDSHADTIAVVDELRRIGWKAASKLMHFVQETRLTEPDFERAALPREKWHEALASQHNEYHWRHRLWRPLTFLFPPTR